MVPRTAASTRHKSTENHHRVTTTNSDLEVYCMTNKRPICIRLTPTELLAIDEFNKATHRKNRTSFMHDAVMMMLKTRKLKRSAESQIRREKMRQ